MAPRSVHSTCDCGCKATFVKVGNRMGDQKFINSSPFVLRTARYTVSFGCICSRKHPAPAWWVMARSPYVLSIKKPEALAVGTLIG
jgi:hypothetical protein